MRIAYKLTNGRASDLRFVAEGYVLFPDEIEIAGDKLPDIETLNAFTPAQINAQTQARLEAAVQAHLDAKAGARGYDGIMSAATYAASADVTFAAEGVGYRNFRDLAWRYCYTQLAAVQAGTRTAPTEAQLIAEIDANCPLVLP